MKRPTRCTAMAFAIFSAASVPVLFTSAAFGQSTTATLLGTVMDETGSVLPGVTVAVKNRDTGISRSVVADTNGAYRVPTLPPGTYEVTASLQGFKTEVRSGIQLAVGQEAVINFTLGIGSIEEQVVVTGLAPLVDTTSAGVTNLVDVRQIRDLPLNGRSFEQLATLQPGVVSIPTAGRNTSQGQGRKLSIAGARPTQISYLLDGTDINDMFNNTPGSAAGNMLGVDTVREFQVVTSTYSAEFGRSAGGTVNAVTRSGTNALHGSGFEFMRDSALDARNFFDVGSEPPPFARNQFGMTIGGPIRRNKTFFFGGYEGLRERLSLSGVARVPTAEARQGRLPGLSPIPVPPAVQQVLNLYPRPNGPEIGGGIATYFSSPKKPTDEHFFMVKVDHRFSDRDSLIARYNFDNAKVTTPDALGVFSDNIATRTQYTMVEQTRIFSPSFVNTARFAYNRSVSSQFNTALVPNVPYLVPRQPVLGVAYGPINVTGLTTLGTGGTNPKDITHLLFEGADTFVVTKGSHAMKFGANIKHYDIDYVSEFTTGAQYTFTSLANLLRGAPQRLEVQLPGVDSRRQIRQSMFGFFAQDDYKVGSRLALNLGLRYEFITVPTEAKGKVTNLRDPLHDTKPTVGNPFFKNPSLRNFAPRLGFAWNPTGSGKSSVRGGFGIFYDEILPASYRTAMSRMPPFWAQGFFTNPPFPIDLESAPLSQAGQRVDAFTFTPDQPRRYQYSLTIQREILPDTVFQIGYIGARGVHLITPYEANTALPQTDAQGNHFFLVDAAGRPLQDVRNPAFRNIRNRLTSGDSWYNSLQLQVQKRFSHGLQFQANYAFAKSIDDSASSVGGTDYVQEQGTPMDPDCIRCDKGLSPFDVRHAFVANFTYELPSASSRGGLARALLHGWQVSGVFTAMSGNPFGVQIGFDRAGQRTRSGGDSQRPSLRTGASNNPITGNPNGWFDVSAFVLPPAGRFGNLARNTLIGPGLQTFDMALVKGVQLAAGRTLQFRAEAFNLFNRSNFAVPRELLIFTGVQVVDGKDVPIVNPSAGRIDSTTTTSRQIQLSVKFVF